MKRFQGHREAMIAVLFSILVAGLLCAPGALASLGDTGTDAQAKAKVVATYGKIPLHFEKNTGQTDAEVKYLSRGKGYSIHLTDKGMVMVLRNGKDTGGKKKAPLSVRKSPQDRETATPPAVIEMEIVGINKASEITGIRELPGKSNYFIGSDPKKWRTNVPNYERVLYRGAYEGIDIVFYGNGRRLEYDFVVKPGAKTEAIELSFRGVEKIRIDERGDLVVQTKGGEVIQRRPVVYQDSGGKRKEIEGSYVLRGESRVGFQVAAYDRGKALVIDPVLEYSTYLGGSSDDYSKGIAVDGIGNAYITGDTFAPDFPTENSFQWTRSGWNDVFVTKLSTDGQTLLYSTYLGGSAHDMGRGIAVDGSGNAYVTGLTSVMFLK